MINIFFNLTGYKAGSEGLSSSSGAQMFLPLGWLLLSLHRAVFVPKMPGPQILKRVKGPQILGQTQWKELMTSRCPLMLAGHPSNQGLEHPSLRKHGEDSPAPTAIYLAGWFIIATITETWSFVLIFLCYKWLESNGVNFNEDQARLLKGPCKWRATSSHTTMACCFVPEHKSIV